MCGKGEEQQIKSYVGRGCAAATAYLVGLISNRLQTITPRADSHGGAQSHEQTCSARVRSRHAWHDPCWHFSSAHLQHRQQHPGPLCYGRPLLTALLEAAQPHGCRPLRPAPAALPAPAAAPTPRLPRLPRTRIPPAARRARLPLARAHAPGRSASRRGPHCPSGWVRMLRAPQAGRVCSHHPWQQRSATSARGRPPRAPR